MHERRPGTTVCLRCRHAARVKAWDQRKRLMLRASAMIIVAATFVVAASLGATAIRAKGEAGRNASAAAARRVVAPPVQSIAAVSDSVPAPVVDSASTRVDARVQQAATPQPRGPELVPIIAEGESPLVDSVTAFRIDSVVTLSFDNSVWRTRNPEKFEDFVRRTLPAIYGHGVDSALTKMPWGSILKQGNLLTELPTRGVRIPLNPAWTIQLFPETRPGTDGPLVIRYRVSVVPATE